MKRYAVRFFQELVEECDGEVRLAAAVADGAAMHLTACRKAQCWKCRQDIEWVNAPMTHVYSLDSIALLIGVKPRYMRQYFGPLVERARARMNQGREVQGVQVFGGPASEGAEVAA